MLRFARLADLLFLDRYEPVRQIGLLLPVALKQPV